MAVDPQYVRRTDQKLRYALVHVDELHAYINQGANDDWENAHEESCLFHLVGAVESTFSEMNDVYGLGLAEHEIGFRKLKECAATNPDLQKTFKVYTDARDGWLGLVYEIRNVMAHRRHHGKLVQMGVARTASSIHGLREHSSPERRPRLSRGFRATRSCSSKSSARATRRPAMRPPTPSCRPSPAPFGP